MVLHRLVTHGPRAGFVLLLCGLVAFGVLFSREAREAEAAVDAARAYAEARASAALEEELRGALDVAHARLEALETLPLSDESGLLLVRDGVQVFPRVVGVERAADAGGSAELINAALRTESRADAGTSLERLGAVLETLRTAGRVDSRGAAELINAALRTESRAEAELISAAQEALLRAWPRLSGEEAAAGCVALQRAAERAGAPAARFEAACARGLRGRRVELSGGAPLRVVGPWVVEERGGTVRGVEVSLAERLEDVQARLLKAGALVDGDALALAPPRAGGLVGVRLMSARLETTRAGVRSVFALKSALLGLTALLGLGVVVLARLAARQKEQTLAAQREFIATVSHELRTPLAGLRLLAETLERKLGPESPARDYPHRLVAAADGLAFLVENILSFNRLESGRWVPRRARFEWASLAPLLEADAALAVDGPVQVRCVGLAALPPASVDAELLKVLVLNLLRNAWKYGQRRPVTFEVTGRVDGGAVVLRLADNGPGIPPAEHERVFEAFHRLPPAEGRSAGGSGLGLALARRVAVLHGGTLRIEASSAEGTTFELRVPMGPE